MHPGDFSAALQGNVAELYDVTADRHAERLALQVDGDRYTHDELRDRAARLAGGLRALDVDVDDRVLLYLPNGAPFVLGALAAFRAGTPFVPANPAFRPRELSYLLQDSGAGLVVTHERLRADAAAAIDAAGTDPHVVTVGEATAREWGDEPFATVDADPLTATRGDDDVAMQPYTSGTTGEPKGVLLTHRNLRAQSLMGFERTNLPATEERFLSVLPLSHIAGFVNRTWQPLVRGGSVYLRDPQHWDPAETMATIERERITKFGAVTTMYVDMVNHETFGDYDLSSLEEAMEGGDGMPADVQRRFEAVAGVELFEAYGLTETGGGTHAGINSTFGRRSGTVGQPLRATDCKLVDEDGAEVATGERGELLVRGPHVMAGYHERPEATEEVFVGDYLRTGDVGQRDRDNYLTIVDRMGDVIVTGGYNVYPREVEEVLHEHPDVVDAAVVGMADERRGETVKAYVVPVDGSASAAGLREHCLDELAPYKHPREIEFVERFPRTTSGKVKKFELPSDER